MALRVPVSLVEKVEKQARIGSRELPLYTVGKPEGVFITSLTMTDGGEQNQRPADLPCDLFSKGPCADSKNPGT